MLLFLQGVFYIPIFYFIGDFIEISYEIKTTGLAGGLY